MTLNLSEWYALKMLACLARAGVPAPGWQLAAVAGCPPPYALKVLKHLAKAGLLRGRKGPGGGFGLALPPAEVTVLRVVQALDAGRLNADFWAHRADGFTGRLTTALVVASDKVRKVLDKVTVADLVEW